MILIIYARNLGLQKASIARKKHLFMPNAEWDVKY